MDDKIQREIERGNPENGSDGKSPRHPPVRLHPGRPIERDHFTPDALGFFPSDRERLNGTADLATRIGQRLAGLGHHGARKLFLPGLKGVSGVLKQRRARIAGQPAHRDRALDRRLHSRFRFGRAGLADMSNRLACVGIAYGSSRSGVRPPTTDQKWTSIFQRTYSRRGRIATARIPVVVLRGLRR